MSQPEHVTNGYECERVNMQSLQYAKASILKHHDQTEHLWHVANRNSVQFSVHTLLL